jgi:uncharacterized FAD-dependent dehydrogenase
LSDAVPNRELEAVITLGMDAEAFMRSNVGRYLAQRAAEEIEVARTSLETVDPEDAKAVRDLQFVIAVARATTSWMKEAIDDGRNAAEQLEARTRED